MTAERTAMAVMLLMALPIAGHALVSPAGSNRVVAGIYAGVLGDVTGDVNADGKASAADLPAVLAGMRNPTWPGPYHVGVRVESFTKTSETTGQPRPLDTVIWYPTEADGPLDTLGGIRDAPVSDALGQLPLLLFSHGSCGHPTQSLFLTPHLAGYGLVVAAPPHPGNRLTDPGCSSGAAAVDSFANRVADVTFVIDTLLAQNLDPGSSFFDRIDAERIGMSGHSFGGQTTLRVEAADPRVIAGLALAPAAVAAGVTAQIEVATMIQGSEFDTLTPFAASQQTAFDRLRPPRFLLQILDTGHFAYSDSCFPGFSDCGPDRLTQDEAHQYVLRYAVPFVLQRLVGDQQFDRFLTTAAIPPGAEFTPDAGG